MFEIEKRFAFTYPRREFAVVGWCNVDAQTPAEDLWIACEGQRTPALAGLLRPEIARRLKEPFLANSGFIARFAAIGRKATATLVDRRNGRDHVLGEFSIGPRAMRPEREGGDYATWLRAHDPLMNGRALVRGSDTELAHTPLLSVVLPTYNTSLYHLHRCIESVRTQQYANWELCITDDGSSDRRTTAFLEQASASDPRIHVTLAAQRGGISVASNRSISASKGDFILLLDHDDELHPSALREVARCLNEHPETDLIYSDEDKIDQLGVRTSPAFKPDYDHDLLCAFDYIGHLVAMRATLVREVGGFSPATDGAQDWDLLLRIAAATSSSRVRHITRPLYHWRAHQESTAHSLDAKPYAARAWTVVLARHTASMPDVSIEEGMFRGSMRLRRQVPEGTRVAVLFRAADGHQREALTRTRVPPGTTFVEVPGGSNADTATLEKLFQSDVIIVIGAAVESVNHFFLEELTAQGVREDCAIVGGTVVQPDGHVLTAGLACRHDGTFVNMYEGMDYATLGYMGLAKVTREVASVAPYAFAFRASRLQAAGSESLHADGFAHLCAALVTTGRGEGLKVLHTPYAVLTLHERTALPDGGKVTTPCAPTLNPNVESFPSGADVLRTGIP